MEVHVPAAKPNKGKRGRSSSSAKSKEAPAPSRKRARAAPAPQAERQQPSRRGKNSQQCAAASEVRGQGNCAVQLALLHLAPHNGSELVGR